MSDEHGWADFADDHDPLRHDSPTHDEAGHGDLVHDDLGHTTGVPHLSGHEDAGLSDYDAAAGHDFSGQDFSAHDASEHEGPAFDAHDQPDFAGIEPHHTDVVDVTDGQGLGPVGTDPDAAFDHADAPISVFPPVVDVGPLPEPVDGFPWIDTGSLNLAELTTAGPAADTTAVSAQDLAAYAATDLPPQADPWAALADSDDPATSALARWWSQNT